MNQSGNHLYLTINKPGTHRVNFMKKLQFPYIMVLYYEQYPQIDARIIIGDSKEEVDLKADRLGYTHRLPINKLTHVYEYLAKHPVLSVREALRKYIIESGY